MEGYVRMSTLYSDGVFYKNNTIFNPFIKEALDNINPGIAVDFGCGIGTNIYNLSKCGWAVYGIDRETIAVESAKEKIDKNRIFCANLLEFDYNLIPLFDVALCNYVLQHMSKENAEKFLFKVDAKAKSDSIFIISFFLKRDGISFSELKVCMNKLGWKLGKEKAWKRLDTNHGEPHFHEGIESIWYKI